MGCGATKLPAIDLPELAEFPVPENEPDYPPPKPPRTTKNEYFNPAEFISIDNNVRKLKHSQAETYEALVGEITNGLTTDLQKLRALYIWLGNQPIENQAYPNVTDNSTPRGYMKNIKHGRGSFTAFFTLLCRAAKLPTVIIQGKGKSMNYEVGDKDFSNLNSQWCAVYVDGDWRIVHVLWSFRAVSGFNQGNWTQIERDRKALNTKDTRSSGKGVTQLNEYYFLTEPEEFIYKCRPDKDPWQLLRTPWSMDKYTSVPYCRENFFSSGLEIISENNCILKSEKGKCWIEFGHDPEVEQNLNYEFFHNEEASGQPLPSDRRLNRFVAYNNEVNKKSFVVRFPCVGVYKMVISEMVEFLLDCPDIGEYVDEFPENPQIGYGYGQTAQSAGFTSSNRNYGFISLTHNETKIFNFVVEDPTNFQAQFKDASTNTDLSTYVQQTVSDNDVSVQVTMPEEQAGDCVLSISNKNSVAINYLISTDNIAQPDSTSPFPVPESEPGYLPPKPPRTTKNEYFNPDEFISIDNNVRKLKKSKAETYEDLVGEITNGLTTDLQKLRALYIWLGNHPIENQAYPNVSDSSTPRGYMKNIKYGTGSFTAFFTLLCRAAKLPTVIIHGKGKSMNYEVGDKDFSDLNSQWCAVYVDGDWRIVHALWSFRAISGFIQGNWTQIEKDGEAVNTKDEKSSGKGVTQLNEYYFLTEPEEFIYKCRPNKDPWQLLRTPWSMDKYTSVPYCRQDFFSSGLKITSEKNCILESEEGKCWIDFKHALEADKDLNYEFFYNEEASGQPLPSDRRLNRFVAYNNEVNKKSFVVRFPCVGVYKIVISKMVEFRLDCSDIGEYADEFPENPKIGYGYGQTAQSAGFTSTNSKYGFIALKHNENKIFKFVVKDPTNFQTQFKNTSTNNDLSTYVHQTVSDNDVSVHVTMPEDQAGDCVLSISNKDSVAINYLISTDNIAESPSSSPFYVPETEPGHPPPKQPRTTKNEYFKPLKFITIDNNVRELKKSKAKTYEALVGDITNGLTTDLQKLRSLYMWLGNQPIENQAYPNDTDNSTPRGYMKDIKHGRGSFTGFFTLLCRAAKLPTVIIQGKGKSKNYEVGDKDFSNLNSQWCAVYVDGDWRIVHVLWSFRAVSGFNPGNWTQIEQDGEAMNTKDDKSSGEDVMDLNEYFFLTDPAEFIYICRPAKDPWQLLRTPWSMDKYTSVPYCRQNFFSSGLRITSKNNCILKSVKGKCWIEFRHDPKVTMRLNYKFFYNEKASGRPLPSDRRLDRFVAYNNEVNKKNFVVRFPCVGVYKIVISEMVEFRLDCSDIGECVEEFPENPQIGYGYGQTAQSAGFTSTNRSYGFISLTHNETKVFNFVVEDPRNFQTQFKDASTNTDLSSYVRQTVSRNIVSVKVKMPKDQEGDCVLTFSNKNHVAINYLISTDNIAQTDSTSPRREEKKYEMLEMPLRQATVSEIASYTRPKPFIHDVMKATYLLLGEREKQLNSWKHIQKLSRKSGKRSLIRRIKEFDRVNLKRPVVHRSDTLLDLYDNRTVCLSSAGAGTFFKWSRNTIDVHEGERSRSSL
ncbi:hypothetical protein LOTGIDRAFT_157825 [Lottia gigantea]|uniref:Transglutaminase-like domain-containing protein n=1 Tax=Lottia gigantea TaxID=225164 RepID=V4A989_LOTGI|nr:hypothetical protein LOTGIDRAFT_157825 [Lottia gigantea]ESP00549.1 hypothetical protein LOTGIDRAFT_157825 [Lottia gigantea]